LSSFGLRPATAADVPRVTELARAAYGHYVERLGGPPRPMTDDYADVVRNYRVTVAELRGEIVGLVVLRVGDEGFLVDNVAVDPSHQGSGVGRALLEHAEAETRRAGFDSIYLYTHAKMTENLALYSRIGYVEYDRRVQGDAALSTCARSLAERTAAVSRRNGVGTEALLPRESSHALAGGCRGWARLRGGGRPSLGGGASPERLEPAHPLFLVGDAALEEGGQELELGVRVGGELVRSLRGRPVQLRGLLSQLRCHLDQHPAAVLRVTATAGEPLVLQAVEQRGHRAGAESCPLSQPPGGHRSLLIEDVEAAIRGAVDAEVVGDRVVEHLRRRL